MDVRKCAFYGRVSTDRQARIEDGGLDTQFSLMERWLELQRAKEGQQRWQLVQCYREEGYSGKNLERPSFKAMLADIEAGTVNTVVVHKIDRITRSLRDFFDLWELFEKAGVQFVSLHESFDTTTAIGRAMLKLILVFAELEREQTSERTAATMLHRAGQGLWNGGRRLGYQLDPEEKGTLKVDPEWAPIVKEHMFEALVRLGSAGKVVTHLHKQGLRNPKYESRRGNSIGGTPFNKPTVIRLLCDPVYVGKIVYKDQVYSGRHEAIIEQELFDRAQEILTKNRQRKSNFHEQRDHVFLLQGLIRCGACGSAMTPKWSTGRGGVHHHYYQCVKASKSANTQCDAKYVPADAAEAYVLDELSKWSMSPEEVRHVIEQANLQKDGRLERIEQDERRLRRHLRELQPKIDSIVTAIADGASHRSVADRLTALEAEKAGAEDQLQTLVLERDQVIQQTLSAELMAESYRNFPEILAALRGAENWQAIKELMACHIEAIDWHQDPADAKKGRMEIMLFEQAEPGELGANKQPAGTINGNGAASCKGRLPDKDSNLGPSG